jgi:ADP-ribosylglycohydrolase
VDLYTQKCVGALMGTFVGDALGMPVEGQPASTIEKKHGLVTEMLEARKGAGTYTDDTQLTIATAVSLLESDGVDRDDLASTYLELHDPARGYGVGTTRVFEQWRDGVPIDEASTRVYDGGSYGNGGAMRIAPVGVLFHRRIDRLASAVRDVVQLTHAHPLGMGGAYLQARAVSRAVKMDPPADPLNSRTHDREQSLRFLEVIREDLPTAWNPDGFWDGKFRVLRELLKAHDRPPAPARVASELGCSSTTGESVPAALFAALIHMDSFEDAVKYAVSIGGDTDTIGAMAGAVSGALYGVGHVPDRWWEKLENGPHGRDDVVEFGEQLAEHARESVVH